MTDVYKKYDNEINELLKSSFITHNVTHLNENVDEWESRITINNTDVTSSSELPRDIPQHIAKTIMLSLLKAEVALTVYEQTLIDHK